MKFGKRLKSQIEETLPEWRDKFLSYKDLKKLVRLISVAPLQSQELSSKAEADFIHLLNVEINKFNLFFIEQEEDFIIQQRELQERIRGVMETYGPNGSRPSEVEYAVEMGRIRKDIVNFHGEMVLLENYSSINYTGVFFSSFTAGDDATTQINRLNILGISGLAKILKKYDKRTGRLLRLPFIEKVLKQPFFTTDLISKLVKECENTMDAVFPQEQEQEQVERGERETTPVAEQSIFRSTVAALITMQELRKGSSTYSHFSLPPLSLPDQDLIQSLQLPSPISIQ